MDRKQKIVEAAATSFSLFGYKATTMDQIARMANVGKGTIYTFFKNKEDLLRFLMNELITEMKKAAEKSFDENLPFQENVHRAIYKMLEFRRQHKLAIKLFEEGKFGTPEVVSALSYFEDEIVHFISGIISQAIGQGYIRPCNPRLTAFILLKIYVALIFDWERNNPSLSKDEIAKLLNMYIFEGLAVHPDSEKIQ